MNPALIQNSVAGILRLIDAQLISENFKFNVIRDQIHSLQDDIIAGCGRSISKADIPISFLSTLFSGRNDTAAEAITAQIVERVSGVEGLVPLNEIALYHRVCARDERVIAAHAEEAGNGHAAAEARDRANTHMRFAAAIEAQIESCEGAS